MRRIRIGLLIAIMTASLLLTMQGFAADGNSERANALNKLSILQGDGKDFNLTGTLKRSEAITFIIRLLGKEQFVLQNQSNYQQTPFSDVKQDAWYAAYVGYSTEQHIVDGFPDGTFRPEEAISEKAFLKLLLGALGYKQDTDFRWETVYQLAFGIGLVANEDYKTKTEDNTNYKRSDVVDAIYNTLSKPINGETGTLTLKMIAANMFNRDLAMELGFVKDSIATKITSASTTGLNSVTINLNEPIATISGSNVAIYETGNSSSPLQVTGVTQNKDSLAIQTANQKSNQSYTIELRNVQDIEGNAYAVISGQFTGFLQPQVTAIQVLSANKITIELNKPLAGIDKSAVLIFESGNPNAALAINNITQSDNKITVQTSNQKPDQKYQLQIQGQQNISGISAEFTGFKINEIKSDSFVVSKVIPVGKNVIQVYFTQPVNSNVALPYFYEVFKDGASLVKGSFDTMSVRAISGQNAVSIYLKNTMINTDGNYSIKVSGDAVSLYGVRLKDGAGDSATFQANYDEIAAFKPIGLFPVSTNAVRVDFSREADISSATLTSNYTLTSSNGVVYSILKATMVSESKGQSVQLSFSGILDKSATYELKVSGVADVYNLSTVPETKMPLNGGGIPDYKNLQIINATALDQGTIQLYFDRPLDSFSATNVSLYTITGVSGVSLAAMPKAVYFNSTEPYKVKLFLPMGSIVTGGNTYKVTVAGGMQDTYGNFSSMPAEFTFAGSNDSNVKPVVVEAKFINNDTLKITTQKELQATGSNLTNGNYWLESKDSSNTTTIKNATNVSLLNGNTLLIKFDPVESGKVYTFKFNTLSELSGDYVRTSSDQLSSASVSWNN